jgi:catechol 2,3-dioxygenase-like lactoylglutathione lyase family enzyme
VTFQIVSIDHVQVAAPPGCEAAAREFYGAILGLTEMEKPAPLRARGGCWFQCGDRQLHVGAAQDFSPARKAHPAFAVECLDELRESLLARGVPVVPDGDLPGTHRFYVHDPWGNRLEFIEARAIEEVPLKSHASIGFTTRERDS